MSIQGSLYLEVKEPHSLYNYIYILSPFVLKRFFYSHSNWIAIVFKQIYFNYRWYNISRPENIWALEVETHNAGAFWGKGLSPVQGILSTFTKTNRKGGHSLKLQSLIIRSSGNDINRTSASLWDHVLGFRQSEANVGYRRNVWNCFDVHNKNKCVTTFFSVEGEYFSVKEVWLLIRYE